MRILPTLLLIAYVLYIVSGTGTCQKIDHAVEPIRLVGKGMTYAINTFSANKQDFVAPANSVAAYVRDNLGAMIQGVNFCK